MTREQIEAMTHKELSTFLAEKVMGWEQWYPDGHRAYSHMWRKPDGAMRMATAWKPCGCREHLAELLCAVPVVAWGAICETLQDAFPTEPTQAYERFLLTCDPLVICRAVAAACCGGDE